MISLKTPRAPLFASLATIAAALVLSACTTSVPAPVVDRAADRSPPRSAPPAVPAPMQFPPPSTQSPGVTTSGAPSPVISERSAPPSSSAGTPLAPGAQAGNTAGSAFHVVQRGETLYRIALNNGLSADALAAWNGLPAGGTIREGQVLRLRPPEGAITSVTPITSAASAASVVPDGRSAPPAGVGTTEPPRVTEPRAQRTPYSDAAYAQIQRGDAPRPTGGPTSAPAQPNAGVTSSDPMPAPAASAVTAAANEPEIKPGNGVDREGVMWTWPTTGRVASKFNDRAPMKGIDIAAKSGNAVVAAAPGKVIYVGKEPRGYGQMIVVSHAKETVSVYFHTDKVLVKEQQRVTLGQRIAEVSDTSGNKMHFEVRKQGRPIDPVTLMPAR